VQRPTARRGRRTEEEQILREHESTYTWDQYRNDPQPGRARGKRFIHFVKI
jgi:hypothetical protein